MAVIFSHKTHEYPKLLKAHWRTHSIKTAEKMNKLQIFARKQSGKNPKY